MFFMLSAWSTQNATQKWHALSGFLFEFVTQFVRSLAQRTHMHAFIALFMDELVLSVERTTAPQ